MHKSLLIHNDNTPLVNLLNKELKTILFSPTVDELNNSDIDTFISTKIIPKVNELNFDIIYIKDTLSDNYIDFYGLLVAYHIRLSSNILNNDRHLVPIVILSDIDSYTINKLTPLGKILFTKNIFISHNNTNIIELFNNIALQKLSINGYINGFLKQIDIKPPKDYLSHHSITNEWAIYQWSQLLGVKEPATIKNENKISSMLYFKYLENKYNLNKKTERPDKIKTGNSKVLLIDDKCADGWEDVIIKFMQKFYNNIRFEAIGKEYKDIDNIDYIKKQVTNKIEDFDPDIILLDLRLLENIDSNEDTISNISGIKILEYIKKQYPSIQIIIFSASTDSLIMDALYKIGILGYIKKDSPTNKYLASKSSSITKLDVLIKQAIEKKYLKNIWNTQNEILKTNFLTNSKESEIFTLRDNVSTVFEILNSNISNPFKYAMLAIFKCIELLCDYYIEDKYNDAFWKDSADINIRINNSNDNSTRNYILNIIEKKTNLSKLDMEDKIQEIVCSRNFAIHTKEKSGCRGLVVKEPKSDDIIIWFKLLKNIINSINITNKMNI